MAKTTPTKSHQIRSRLDHPIIDADGHVLEVMPVFLDYLREVGGSDAPQRFLGAPWITGTNPAWWTMPTKNTLDRASALLPGLLYRRLDDLGIDYCVLYPTEANQCLVLRDAELRQVACRAFNRYQADMFREFSDRLTPAALIPMHTPEEAIDELEHAAQVLHLKVGCFSIVRRPEARPHPEDPARTLQAGRLDTFGIDSDYDYDPVWAKFLELKIAATSHSVGSGWGSRLSPTNFAFNRLLQFDAAGEVLCKSLFMGGVTRRFPGIRIAFLEGGVGWACTLYSEMVGTWRKRNPTALREHLDPALLDRPLLMRLFSEYGDKRVQRHMDTLREFYNQPRPEQWRGHFPQRPDLDDWAPAKLERAEDVRDLFVPNFFFGCEADAPTNTLAFNAQVNPFGARLRAIFGSDIGHWDVTDMEEVVEEAFEPVEQGLITEEDFKEFVFLNAVSLYTDMNPEFFKGTRIEADVERARSSTNNASG